jgi:hypothetical protein
MSTVLAHEARRTPSSARAADGEVGGHRLALLLLAGTLLLWALGVALALHAAMLPDTAGGTVAVVYPPGMTDAERFSALLSAGGGLERNTRFDNVWIVRGETPGFVGRLRRAGAWRAFHPVAFELVAFPGCVLGVPAGVAEGSTAATGQ